MYDETCFDEYGNVNQCLLPRRQSTFVAPPPMTFTATTTEQFNCSSDADKATVRKVVTIEEPEQSNKVDILVLLPEKDGQYLLE